MSGKGSSPRAGVFDRPFPGPLAFFYDNRSPQEKYEDNWDAIFGKKHCGTEDCDDAESECRCECEICK